MHKERLEEIKKFIKQDELNKEYNQLAYQMSLPDFWKNQEEAKKVSQRFSSIGKKLASINEIEEFIETMESDGFSGEWAELVNSMLDRLEIDSFLSSTNDYFNAIISIKAGAGGKESTDWASMLFRMYQRWIDQNGYTCEIEDIQSEEKNLISTATFRVVGDKAYGRLKSERGVHRLVRISPFDSNARRHTSFCAVDVVAEIEDDIDVDIKDEDLKVDVYRASGSGGQHVNRTESAVRFTHIPTGIVVACQRERSQHRNRDIAMKILKSKIYDKLQDDKKLEQERFYGEKGDIGWGNQIRSYVFCPYQMVKDLRTGHETSNIEKVMDGDINKFMDAYLRAGCPTKRNKE